MLLRLLAECLVIYVGTSLRCPACAAPHKLDSALLNEILLFIVQSCKVELNQT